MKPRHVAASALVGWYLMVPWPYSRNLPLSLWSVYKTYDSSDECDLFRGDIASGILQDAPPDFVEQFGNSYMDVFKQARCISSDDPRLKS